MKRNIIKIFVLAIFAVILCINAAADTDTDGFILIDTPEEFLSIKDNLDGDYRLSGNIDFSGKSFSVIGTKDTPFSGNLDGAGYTVKNIDINASSPSDAYTAVFAANSGTISNVIFENITVRAISDESAYAAVVASINVGSISDLTVTNSSVYAKSDYFTARAGTITAYNYKLGTVRGCTASAKVTAESTHLYADAAGITAVNLGKISTSESSGYIVGSSVNSDAAAGGICAVNAGSIDASKNSGSIRVITENGTTTADGVCANNTGTVTECENTGEIFVGPASEICGDVDGDGELSPADATTLVRHLASWRGYEADKLNLDLADTNNDGTVNLIDPIILNRHTAGWLGYESLPLDNN